MPADFSALLDSLLVIAGLVLVVIGLVMFIYSKTSTQASSVEAFGIKLNVTHPSLILVLAGVGLMLAPRLLPGLPGKADDKPVPAVVAEAPPVSASPGTTAVPIQPPPPVSPSPAAAPAVPQATPIPPAPAATVSPAHAPAQSAATASSAPARPAPAAKPRAAAPETAATTPAPRVAIARPAAAPAATVQPEAAAPPAAARPARPMLAFAALGLPISRSFWGGETRASYTQRMNLALQQAGREVLRMDARGLELGQTDFNTWWNESGQHPRSRELCDSAPAPHALLSARVESPTTSSSAESAYWPELKMRLYVCANQRLYRQQKTLSPQNDDAWPFATELNSEIERFLRTYRGDLTE